MINFEEELKHFKPNPEVADAEDSINKRDLTDVADIISELLRQQRMPEAPKKQQAQEAAAPEGQLLMTEPPVFPEA